MKLIDKAALVAEIEKLIDEIYAGRPFDSLSSEQQTALWYVKSIMLSVNTLEVIDPYEQCIQYASIESGIKAHAEEYSFNIESELFNQLTKEQQALWRKEIEQACINGGYNGLDLAKDPRYKENLEVKEPVSEEFENIVEEIAEPTILNAYGTKELARRLRNTICGTSVSEGLEDAAVEWFNSVKYKSDLSGTPIEGFKAGAQWQLERVKEALLSEVLPCFMHGGEADEVVAKLDEVLKQK